MFEFLSLYIVYICLLSLMYFVYVCLLSFNFCPCSLFTFVYFVIVFAGASIHACRNVDRHIAALEEDKAIFDAVLAPLIRPAVTRRPRQPRVVIGLDDMDDEDIVAEPIVKKSRFSK